MARAGRVGETQITILGVHENRVAFTLVCLECGGYEQVHRGAEGIMAMVHCAACNVWMGRLAALTARAARQAKDEGYPIDLRRLIYELQGKPLPPEGATESDA